MPWSPAKPGGSTPYNEVARALADGMTEADAIEKGDSSERTDAAVTLSDDGASDDGVKGAVDNEPGEPGAEEEEVKVVLYIKGNGMAASTDATCNGHCKPRQTKRAGALCTGPLVYPLIKLAPSHW